MLNILTIIVNVRTINNKFRKFNLTWKKIIYFRKFNDKKEINMQKS